MSILKFIGSGSAFNTKLGNNSAYYKDGDKLLLIDCGSNIFQRIKESNLLDGISEINVLVTHCHADHVGSLADLILYSYYSHGEFTKSKVKVISPFDTKVSELLKINGCVEGIHHTEKLIGGNDLIKLENMNIKYSFNRSKHVNEIPSYAIELMFEVENVYYSGDSTGEFFRIKNKEKLKFFDEMYVDTSKADYKGNVHLSLRELTQLVPFEYRNRIWCMHLDEGFIREEAEELGFNVVKNELLLDIK